MKYGKAGVYTLHCLLPEDLEHYIIRKANEEGVSMSEIVRRALREMKMLDDPPPPEWRGPTLRELYETVKAMSDD